MLDDDTLKRKPFLALIHSEWLNGPTVLHLGGDFGKFKLMLRPAGCSKKSQKIRGCQRATIGISGNFLVPPTNLYLCNSGQPARSSV